MAEEQKQKKVKEQKTENKTEAKTEVVETNAEDKTQTSEKTEKVKEAKEKKQERVKKDYALVHGVDLHLSPKECFSVCNMIRGRTIETAMKMLEEVLVHKRVVKMNNREVPHQHGKGVMAGRFPENAVEEFIRLVKNLKANAIYNELDLEKCIISCNADIASKPFKRGGARFKRAHIMIRLDKKKEVKNNKTETKQKENKK